jgi:hypothetical protein
MRILAIDPGRTTGFSFIEVITYIDKRKNPTESDLKIWEKRCNHDEFIQEIIDAWPTHVVCESFVHTHRDNVDYTPVEYIGLVKWLHIRHKFELEFQTPSYRKRINEDDLKHLGLYLIGKKDANAATQHRIQYQIKNGWFDLTRLKK